MPSYLLNIEVWKSLWPLPTTALIISLLLILLVLNNQEKRELLLTLFAFSMLGIVTGYLTGFSRESVVGAVLPAVLSLIGAMAVFLMQKDKSIRLLVVLVVLTFSINLVIGTTWGSIMRNEHEQYSEYHIDFNKKLQLLKDEVLLELEIRDYREDLGLPPDDK